MVRLPRFLPFKGSLLSSYFFCCLLLCLDFFLSEHPAPTSPDFGPILFSPGSESHFLSPAALLSGIHTRSPPPCKRFSFPRSFFSFPLASSPLDDILFPSPPKFAFCSGILEYFQKVLPSTVFLRIPPRLHDAVAPTISFWIVFLSSRLAPSGGFSRVCFPLSPRSAPSRPRFGAISLILPTGRSLWAAPRH